MEILYCSGCQIRLTGNDLESGRAVRIEGRAYCRACAPATLPARPVPAAPAPPRVGTARRAAEPRPPSTGHGPLLWATGAALVVAAAVPTIALLGSHGTAVPASVALPEPPPRNAPAVAKPQPDRRAAQWAELSRQVEQSCAREEFGLAVGLLERAQGDGKDADWAWMLRRRQSEIRAQAQERLAGILEEAAQAKRQGDRAHVDRLCARVAAWKLPECAVPGGDAAAPAPGAQAGPAADAPPSPNPAVEAQIKPSAGSPGAALASSGPSASEAPGGAFAVVYDDHLARGWKDWSFSVQRDFAASAPPGGPVRCLGVSFERTGAGIYLHAPRVFEAGAIAALEFSCRPSGKCPILLASLVDQDHKFSDTPRIDRFGGPPPTGEWKRYVIPFSAFKAENRSISGIVIQAVGTEVGPDRVYFDKILLRLVR